MAIKTKSIFQPPNREDGIRILITRFYPRGVERTRFDEWAISLAPSQELLFSYRNGNKNWSSFKRSFLIELRDNVESIEAIHVLNEVSRKQNVTLLCYEQSGVACHRHIVRDVVESPELIDPQDLRLQLQPEHANYDERSSIQRHISYEKTPVVTGVLHP
ncbi:DUF488 family protein [Candidatus Bathyarchaeota archaeon]|nr:MAG: DUF488 family protein [Candidatus Bathyarchaeota archaeon]